MTFLSRIVHDRQFVSLTEREQAVVLCNETDESLSSSRSSLKWNTHPAPASGWWSEVDGADDDGEAVESSIRNPSESIISLEPMPPNNNGPPPPPGPGAAPPQPEMQPCYLCDEELPMLAIGHSAASGLRDHVTNFREEIFKLEKALVGQQDDLRIFQYMLKMRQKYVERPLEHNDVVVPKWTLPMIQRHYDPDPTRGCRFNSLRLHLNEMRALADDLRSMRKALHVIDPETNQRMLNTRSIDPMVRLSKHYLSVVESVDKRLEKQKESMEPVIRSLVAALHYEAPPVLEGPSSSDHAEHLGGL